jgi:hypothetical protein
MSIFDDILSKLGASIDRWDWADRKVSKLAIDQICASTWNRPHPWSTASDYTSWKGLTDKTYLARHLPATDLKVQPPWQEVQKLFQRPQGAQLLSKKSTCLFPAFAQYLTDGFIRTNPRDPARTTSNHEIDLCPLYGRTEQQTLILREDPANGGRKGRLKSQMIGDEEFPPYLYASDGGKILDEFAGLDPPLLGPSHLPDPPPDRLATLFAVGGDRANATPFTAMMNTLLLREHNRIAGELEVRNPTWDDERVFQTARNIMIPLFIKIVVEQYINHISDATLNLVADPSVAWGADWNRPNWMTAEFSLLYRWHSLLPDAIHLNGTDIPLAQFGLDNRPLVKGGLVAAFLDAAEQPAAELGAFNTAEALLPIEQLSVMQARSNRLASYNAYRKQFSMKPAESFSDISTHPDIIAQLQALYPTPDDVEFYPGLFAEDRVPKSPLPGLLLRMVAVDAFTQALTNPLLSEHVFNEDTFTAWGFDLISSTRTLGDILKRQGTKQDPLSFTMTQPSWSHS